MIGLRSVVSLCVLCGLVVGACATESASAATNGTTGTAPAGAHYSGTIVGEGGETLLHSVISGIEVEFKSTELAGGGEMESMLAETGEHTANGSGTLEYKSVTVVKPAGKGCKVKGGEVKTNKLKATTAGQGMGLKIEPAEATPLAKFEVEGCGPSEALKALNGTYEVTGSVIGTPTEGTNETKFERTGTTTQNTLKLRGQKAGIAGVLKLKTSGGEALKASTVETVGPPKGTTAFTCVHVIGEAGTVGFSKDHCKPADAAVNTNVHAEHVGVAESALTDVQVSNSETGAATGSATPFTFRTTVAGVPFELSAGEVTGEGWAENSRDVGGEHYVHGRGTIVFKQVEVVQPENCVVRTDEAGPPPKEGAVDVIDSELLEGTTTEQGHFVKFTPVKGEVLATFWLTCAPELGPPLEVTWEVKGSVKGVPDGATINFTHAETTAQDTLKANGLKAGIGGSLSVSGKGFGALGFYKPLSVTTVETS